MSKSFNKYLQLRENSGSGTRAEIKLGKDNDFKPFTVDKGNHPNLRTLIQAFLGSAEIPIDTEIDPAEGGTRDINMKKKMLYLTGGGVRDHLLGKTPKDFDLVTDATPPQIRRILKQADFTEVKNAKGQKHPKGSDKSLPDKAEGGKVFWANGWDGEGTDASFTIKMGSNEYELATMRKNHKGESGVPHDKLAFSGIEGDADGRDFTINAMYLPLDQADGANSKLIDLHGGIHHLKSGTVQPIGKFRERLDEDPLRALRYIRFAARFGKTDRIPPEHQEAIEEIKDLSDVPKERIKAEFIHGLEHPEVDPKKYIKLYKDLGALDKVFPNMQFELNVPEDFADKHDRILAVAWILRNNDSVKVGDTLHDNGWENREVNDITYLISLYQWATTNKFSSVFFQDMKDKMIRTNLVPSKIRTWGQMAGLDMKQINQFLNDQVPMKGSTIMAKPTEKADFGTLADKVPAKKEEEKPESVPEQVESFHLLWNKFKPIR